MIKTGQEPRSGNAWVVFDQKLDSWKAWEQGYNHPFSTPFHKKQQEVASFPDSVEEPENEGITQ